MRAQKRHCTVTRPHVDRNWLPNVQQLRMTTSKDSEGYHFVDWYDIATGVVVYTTPQRPNFEQVRQRAHAWRRRHGFMLYSALQGGGYIKVIEGEVL